MIASHVHASTRPARHHLALATAATGLATVIAVAAVSMADPARAAGPPDIGLGTASQYSVLADEGVTNTGPTTVVGLVASGASITTVTDNGAISPPGNVRQGASAAVTTAKSNLLDAYNQAAAAPTTPKPPLPADIGGLTLVGGTYTQASSLGFTGILTLDGENDPNSVWVIQVGESFSTSTGAQVLLTRGAQACHVYWQIGEDAVIETGTAFQGTMLAENDISARTGATIKGRLLSNVGAITLDTNTFTSPACAAATPPASSSAPVAPAPTATKTPTPKPTKSTGSGKSKGDRDEDSSDDESSDGSGGSGSGGSDGDAGGADGAAGTDADADGSTSTSTGIPNTGGPPMFLAPVGAVVLLAGAGLVVASRRRRPGAHRS